jgi:ABC-type nitrate/sulfonate/bicarbonate transport system substrate-binding protein
MPRTEGFAVPRRLLAVALALTLTSGCAAAASGSGGSEVTELRYQGSVGSVSFPELAEDLGYLGKLKLKWIGNTISGPQDIQSAATGQIDFGGAFNGAVVKLIAQGAPVKAVIGYYGVDEGSYNGFYVKDGSPISSAAGLKGKKIGMNTLGAHHEAVLDEYLNRNGFSDADIREVEPVVVPPVNTEQALRAGQIDVGVLGGILRDKALARGGIHPLFTDFDIFGKFTAGTYVLTKQFIAKNPKATKTFVEATAKAIAWSQSHTRQENVAKFVSIIEKRHRKEDTSAIRLWKSAGVAGKGGVINKSEFETWISWLERRGALKKKLELKDVYTNEYNPFKAEAR